MGSKYNESVLMVAQPPAIGAAVIYHGQSPVSQNRYAQ